MSDSPQVKLDLTSNIIGFVYELPHELPNDLRLRILGDKKISRKSKNLVGTRLNAQSLVQRQIFGNSGQKLSQSRC